MPEEFDVAFEATRGGGGIGAGLDFKFEKQVQLEDVGASLREAALDGGEKARGTRHETSLLDHFALDGFVGGFAEFDVPSEEVDVSVFDVAAEEDHAVAHADAAGNEFGGLFVRFFFHIFLIFLDADYADGHAVSENAFHSHARESLAR